VQVRRSGRTATWPNARPARRLSPGDRHGTRRIGNRRPEQPAISPHPPHPFAPLPTHAPSPAFPPPARLPRVTTTRLPATDHEPRTTHPTHPHSLTTLSIPTNTLPTSIPTTTSKQIQNIVKRRTERSATPTHTLRPLLRPLPPKIQSAKSPHSVHKSAKEERQPRAHTAGFDVLPSRP
jgi:hypothetical protein